ncbi:MAG TPA: hypothetical protein PKL68_05775 [Actinomycetota bacterium]|nr:hypothetical protein [Actinomycetota bacterium]HNL51445.1 hypothetical protein [Actinomycetota bacterium]HNO15016.1 hypothetical protein [Actinomycetota bacterium]
MGPDVHVVVTAEGQRGVAEAALEFLKAGGDATGQIVYKTAQVDPRAMTVGFTADVGAGLTLVDEDGWDWQCGNAVCRSLLAGDEAVTVRLVNSEGSGSVGRVGVLRTTNASVQAGMAVLGPLIVQYLNGARISGPPPGGAPEASVPIRAADRRGAWRFAGRLLRASVTVRNWQVARLPGSIDDVVAHRLPPVRMVWQGPRRRAFWADPCVVADNAEEWVFIEELGRRSGVGVIRAARYDGHGLVTQQVVLATAHHLSYPQIYKVGDRWLATVETCAATNPVYTFDRLGGVWRPATDLPAMPPHLADAVLHFDSDGNPVAASGTDARVNGDAVFVRYHWDGQAWSRDDPSVYVDVRRGRGGGTDDSMRGLRAVQDCAGTYGRATSLLEDDLTPVVVITARDVPPSADRRRRQGVHTLTWTSDGSVVWCDGWLRRFTPLGGFWRLRERRHSQVCDG